MKATIIDRFTSLLENNLAIGYICCLMAAAGIGAALAVGL